MPFHSSQCGLRLSAATAKDGGSGGVVERVRDLNPLARRKDEAGQLVAIDAGRVDADPVLLHENLPHRRVTEDDRLGVAPRKGVKLFANPEKILGVLLLQRDARPDPAVHKEMLIGLIVQTQTVQKIKMGSRDAAQPAIAFHRRGAAVVEKQGALLSL